jgi:hypothetical protein
MFFPGSPQPLMNKVSKELLNQTQSSLNSFNLTQNMNFGIAGSLSKQAIGLATFKVPKLS